MQQNDADDPLVFVAEKPDVKGLQKAYEDTRNDLADYFNKCQDSFDQRRNYWPGKSSDLRKNAVDAFPWKGASDTEVHVINERINTYVALCLTSLARANIRAYPVEAGDMARAKVVSSFLKWMIATYIPSFKQQMELGSNYMFERGLMISYVGWEREKNKFLQNFSLEQIAAQAPDLAKAILEGDNDDEIIALMQGSFPDLSKKRGKKALNDLRKTGTAQMVVSRVDVDRPCVKACAPDEDVFFPPYCMDPNKAPYVFYRCKMTAQEILNRVQVAGWDKDWAEYIIEHCSSEQDPYSGNANGVRRAVTGLDTRDGELYDIVRVYQRLIDDEDGSQGIYCTVMHPKFEGNHEVQGYGKHELLSGFKSYPFIVTPLSHDNARMYDLQTIPELLKGVQWQVKVERDSRVDRNSMATLPPLMHPIGKPPSDWGPGRMVGRMRQGDYEYGATPAYNPGSVEIETTMLMSADKLMGLDIENPLSASRRQFFVDKFLAHVRDVIKMAYNAFQRYGPDELFFRVTGVPDAQKFTKGNPDEDFDINISFDVQNTDPEIPQKQIEQFIQLLGVDRSGRMNVDNVVEIAANAINPILADAILQPIEASQQKMVKDVTDDLTKIFSGIEVGARPNGAQMALSIVQQYAAQPDVAKLLGENEAFKERLTKYAEQYQFALTQMQNAEIGRIGTAPAQVGGVGTQTANSQNY